MLHEKDLTLCWTVRPELAYSLKSGTPQDRGGSAHLGGEGRVQAFLSRVSIRHLQVLSKEIGREIRPVFDVHTFQPSCSEASDETATNVDKTTPKSGLRIARGLAVSVGQTRASTGGCSCTFQIGAGTSEACTRRMRLASVK